jgi:carboxymethylenebutenolidase
MTEHHGDRSIMGMFETLDVGAAKARLYVAGDFTTGAPGVVVLHAWWGLNDDAIAYADRLAASGFAVVAPDMFDGKVASTVEDADRLSSEAEDAKAEPPVESIAGAAVDDLARRLGPASQLGVLGFSFGAAYATLLPAESQRLIATVVYYGVFTGPHIAGSSAAFLGHFAETDQFESDEAIAELEESLRAAGRDATIHRYPGTGHWFAEPSRDAYRPDAADLAFERTVGFLRERLGPTEGAS